MRTIALLGIAVCAGATSVQAQVAEKVEKVVVQHGNQGYGCNSGVHFGCCEKDVSHCFDLWSTYCQDRRCHKACSPRRAVHAQSCGHGGMFDFNLCSCGPKFGHSESACDVDCESDCEAGDCVGSGYEGDSELQQTDELQAPGAEAPPAPPAVDRLDSAEDIQESPSDVEAPGAEPPLPPVPNNSAGRWYLPFKWKN